MNAPIIPPLKIYFIRHGETDWSLSGQHTSVTEIVLNAEGESQARKLGERLRSICFSRVFTSPRKRAQQTFALSGLTHASEIEPDLTEWDYGDYEGRRSVDIRKDRPGWNLFRDGCPDGETPIQVCERADRLILRLRSLTGNIALFTHGQFGSVLAVRWIGLPVINAENLPLSTASLSLLTFAANHPEVPTIALFNSI
jgi:broad specificity phosphatase PhoE